MKTLVALLLCGFFCFFAITPAIAKPTTGTNSPALLAPRLVNSTTNLPRLVQWQTKESDLGPQWSGTNIVTYTVQPADEIPIHQDFLMVVFFPDNDKYPIVIGHNLTGVKPLIEIVTTKENSLVDGKLKVLERVEEVKISCWILNPATNAIDDYQGTLKFGGSLRFTGRDMFLVISAEEKVLRRYIDNGRPP